MKAASSVKDGAAFFHTLMKKLFIISMVLLSFSCMDRKETISELVDLSWGSAHLCIEKPIAPGEGLCYQITFKLDTLAFGSELAKQLDAVLCDSVLCVSGYATVSEAMTAFADSMEREWKAELAEMYEPDSEFKETLQYYYAVEGKPLSDSVKAEESNQETSTSRGGLSGSVLSYQVTTDCYLGGAHGSYVVQYFNFDKTSGKLISIGDIVPAEKEKAVLMAMQDKLCEDWSARDLADLQEKTGITMLGDLYLTSNFLIEGDSITFLFNQYEIAPYAAGLISVTVERP